MRRHCEKGTHLEYKQNPIGMAMNQPLSIYADERDESKIAHEGHGSRNANVPKSCILVLRNPVGIAVNQPLFMPASEMKAKLHTTGHGSRNTNAPTGLNHPAPGCGDSPQPGDRAGNHSNPDGVASEGREKMPQSLSCVRIHLVFSTKNRQPFLRDPAIREEMHAYLGGVSGRLDCPPLIVGGADDHVHLLCFLGRTISQADWVKEVKRVSSTWVKKRDPALTTFAWQNGYGTFSVSASATEKTRDYIARQAEHHCKQSFQDEYRSFLRKYELEWDERYVWD